MSRRDSGFVLVALLALVWVGMRTLSGGESSNGEMRAAVESQPGERRTELSRGLGAHERSSTVSVIEDTSHGAAPAFPSAPSQHASGSAGAAADADRAPGGGPSALAFGSDEDRGAMEARWREAPKDPVWTGETQHDTAAMVADARLPPERLVGVDCRGTLCRVQFHLPDLSEAAVLRDMRDPDAEMRVFSDGPESHDYSVFISKLPGGTEPSSK